MKSTLILLMLIPVLLFAQEEKYKKIPGVKYMRQIQASNDAQLNPGQVSKDSKRYYCPEITADGKAVVKVYDMKFKLLSAYQVEIPEGMEFAGKISLTEDEQVLLFTVTTDNSWSNNDLVIAEFDPKTRSYRKPRLLGEVNESGVADAYPYISADGLRIYWVRDNYIMYSSRKDRKFVFRYPDELKLQYPESSVLSCWLSSDELTLYFITLETIIYKCTRKSLSEPFSTPEIFSDKWNNAGFFSAVNVVSPYIFMFYSPDEYNKEMIIQYKMK